MHLKKSPLWKPELMKMNCVHGFFFLSLLWVKKVSFWILEFCLMCLFFFRSPEISRRAQAHFPQWEPLSSVGLSSWPLPALDSFPRTSRCFHDTATGNVPQRPWAGSQPTCYDNSVLENTWARELLPGRNIFSSQDHKTENNKML